MASPVGFLLLDAAFSAIFADSVVQEALTAVGLRDGTFEAGLNEFIRFVQMLATSSQVQMEFDFYGRRWRWSQFTCNRCEGGSQTLHAFVLGPAAEEFTHITALAGMYRLTRREAEALGHYVHGLAIKEVAAELGVTPSTAKTFLRSICGKMGVSSRSELMSTILTFTCTASFTCPFKTPMSRPLPKKSEY